MPTGRPPAPAALLAAVAALMATRVGAQFGCPCFTFFAFLETGPEGSFSSVGVPGSHEDCLCAWVLEYSEGPTDGRLELSVDLDAGSCASGEDRVQIFSDHAGTDLITRLCGASRDSPVTVVSSTGTFFIEYITAAGSSSSGLSGAYRAINAPPQVTALLVKRTFDTSIRVSFGEPFPFPYHVVDHDNWDQGLEVFISVVGSNPDDPQATLISIPATPPSVVFSVGANTGQPQLLAEARFVGPGSVVSALVAATTIVPQSLGRKSDALDFFVSDMGNSGEGGPAAVQIDDALVPVCDSEIVVVPENETFSSGFDFVVPFQRCTARIHRVFRLAFDMVDLQFKTEPDPDDPTNPCAEYFRVWDGSDDDAGVLLSTELSEDGYFCSPQSASLPTYESVTGSMYFEMVVGSEYLFSAGFEASIVGTPGLFSVAFVDLDDESSTAFAATGTALSLPRAVVFDLPGTFIRVTVSASSGTVALANPASFSDIVVGDADHSSELVLEDRDQDRPLARISSALAQVVYRSPPEYQGSDVVTFVAQTDNDVTTAPLELDINVLSLGVNAQSAASTQTRHILPLSAAIQGQDGALLSVAISVLLPTSRVSVDPRTASSLIVGFSPSLTVTGSSADINAALASLTYYADLGGADVVTLTVTDTTTLASVETTIAVDVDDMCRGFVLVNSVQGTITDRTGNPTDRYDPGVTCTWTIIGPQLLVFNRFDLDFFSFVNVHAGETVEDPIINSYVFGNRPGSTIHESPQGKFHIHFFSNEGITLTGFELAFGPAPGTNVPPVVLGPVSNQIEVVRLATLPLQELFVGDMDSPDGTLSLSVVASAGEIVPGDVTGVDLVSSSRLSVLVEGDSTSVDAFLTSTAIQAPSELSTYPLTLTATDQDGGSTVLEIAVQVQPCGGLVAVAAGDSFGDGSGSQPYTDRLECSWLLTGATAPAVLAFDFFDLECPDSLRIFDGSSADGRELGTFCARAAIREQSLVSYSGAFFVQLTTDSTAHGDGFQATYRSVPSASWLLLEPAPAGFHPVRSFHMMAVLARRYVFVAGGTDDLTSVWAPVIFDLDLLAWRLVDDAPAGAVPGDRVHAMAAALDDTVFVFGGNEQSPFNDDLSAPLNELWVGQLVVGAIDQDAADPVGIRWTQIDVAVDGPVPVGAGALCPLAASGRVALFGGRDADGAARGDLWVFDPSTEAWALAAPESTAPLAARHRFASAADPDVDRLFIMGGIDGDGEALADVWVYEWRTGAWSQLASAPTARHSGAMVLLPAGATAEPTELLVTGGIDEVGASLGDVWSLNTTTGDWLELRDDTDAAVYGHSAAPADFAERSALLGFGGEPGSVYGGSARVLSLALSVDTMAPRLTPLLGGTLVTITGDRFSECANAQCVVGLGVSNATVLGERSLVCTTPPTLLGATSQTVPAVACSQRTKMPLSQGPIVVYSDPVLVSLEPLAGVPGTLVTIALDVDAFALDAADAPLCQFGTDTDPVAGSRGTSGATLTCLVPDDGIFGPREVRVALDGQQFGYSVLVFRVESRTDAVGSLVMVVAIVAAVVVLGIFVYGRVWYQRQAVARLAAAKAPWQIDYEQLEIESEIAAGSFGVVWKGLFRGSDVAIKLIKSDQVSLQMMEEFRHESNLMSELRHPNVVLFMGACTIPPNMAIVLEYMAMGSLYHLIHDEDVFYSWPQVRQFALDIIRGMNYLHAADPPILHRDLKSLNVLVDSKGWTMKVSDFGLTEVRDEHKKLHGQSENEVVGSIYWMAPEVLRREAYVKASDTYSFAVVLWEMCVRLNPYDGMSPVVVAARVSEEPQFRPTIEEDLPKDLFETINKCWAYDHNQRPSFDDLKVQFAAAVKAVDSGPMSSSMVSSADSQGMQVTAPRGRVFVVFAGIERASSMWEVDPEGMRDVLRSVQLTIKQLAGLRKGYLGSSDREVSMAVFELQDNAVRYCMDLQSKMLEIVVPDKLLAEFDDARVVKDTETGAVLFSGVRMWCGMHVGKPVLSVDPRSMHVSYDGPIINWAAAIGSRAAGGQVLVSEAAAEGLDTTQDVAAFDIGQVDLGGGQEKLTALYPARLRRRHDILAEASLVRTQATSPRQVTEWKAALLHNPQWVIPFAELELGAVVGTGSYGSVHRGLWNGTPVACKLLFRKNMAQQQKLELQAEVGISSGLRHPNICQFLGVCLDADHLCLVTEFASQGSLHDALITNRNVAVGLQTRAEIAMMIARGMAYLHQRTPPLLHRDLKPKNILVGDSWAWIKIADFGLSRTKAQNQTMTKAGTSLFMAPEVLRGEKYGEAADVFSFAIVFWEIAHHETAYQHLESRDVHSVTRYVLGGGRPVPTKTAMVPPVSFVQIIEACWDGNPDSRPPFGDLARSLEAVKNEVGAGRGLPPIPRRSTATVAPAVG